jgi:hypothetical protein
MPKFRTKPHIVEAFRYAIDCRPDWFCDMVSQDQIVTYPQHFIIRDPDGPRKVAAGSWVILNNQGEVYTCTPAIFEATYEPVEPDEASPTPAPKVEVYSRSDCVFNYCPYPDICRAADRCQHKNNP